MSEEFKDLLWKFYRAGYKSALYGEIGNFLGDFNEMIAKEDENKELLEQGLHNDFTP